MWLILNASLPFIKLHFPEQSVPPMVDLGPRCNPVLVFLCPLHAEFTSRSRSGSMGVTLPVRPHPALRSRCRGPWGGWGRRWHGNRFPRQVCIEPLGLLQELFLPLWGVRIPWRGMHNRKLAPRESSCCYCDPDTAWKGVFFLICPTAPKLRRQVRLWTFCLFIWKTVANILKSQSIFSPP